MKLSSLEQKILINIKLGVFCTKTVDFCIAIDIYCCVIFAGDIVKGTRPSQCVALHWHLVPARKVADTDHRVCRRRNSAAEDQATFRNI